MITRHRNIRVNNHPWEPAGERARERFGVNRSVVVRALLLAFVAGEADDLVAKFLPGAGANAGGQGHDPGR